jgi:hypothetical protein
MDSIFIGLNAFSMIGCVYIGYTKRQYIKNIINSPSILPYKNKLNLSDNNFINEDKFCGITGGLTGLFIGRLIWPITIPIILLTIENDYGKQIRKFIKEIKN